MDGFKGQRVQDVKKLIQKKMVDNVRNGLRVHILIALADSSTWPIFSGLTSQAGLI